MRIEAARWSLAQGFGIVVVSMFLGNHYHPYTHIGIQGEESRIHDKIQKNIGMPQQPTLATNANVLNKTLLAPLL